MNYDPRRHITHEMLAEAAGITNKSLARRVVSLSAPQPLGDLRIARGKTMRFYSRRAALAWASTLKTQARGEIVPPRTPAAFKPLTLSPGLRDNFARAAQLYPHTLRSHGNSIGNGLQYGSNATARFA